MRKTLDDLQIAHTCAQKFQAHGVINISEHCLVHIRIYEYRCVY